MDFLIQKRKRFLSLWKQPERMFALPQVFFQSFQIFFVIPADQPHFGSLICGFALIRIQNLRCLTSQGVNAYFQCSSFLYLNLDFFLMKQSAVFCKDRRLYCHRPSVSCLFKRHRKDSRTLRVCSRNFKRFCIHCIRSITAFFIYFCLDFHIVSVPFIIEDPYFHRHSLVFISACSGSVFHSLSAFSSSQTAMHRSADEWLSG